MYLFQLMLSYFHLCRTLLLIPNIFANVCIILCDLCVVTSFCHSSVYPTQYVCSMYFSPYVMSIFVNFV